MVALRNLPLPFGEPIAKPTRQGYKPGEDPQAGFMSLPWINALTANQNQMDSMPVKAASVSLTDQSAGISATDMTGGKLNTGQYRLSYWYAVTSIDGVASDVQVDFDYTYRGTTITITGADLNGDDKTKVASDVVFIPVDGNTPVRYTVTYSSTTPGAMRYDLFVCLENVPL